MGTVLDESFMNDQAPITESEMVFDGPPPEIGGLYRIVNMVDCDFVEQGWCYSIPTNELPFVCLDVIMIVGWVKDGYVGRGDWYGGITASVLTRDKVVAFRHPCRRWNMRFKRVGSS